MEPCCEVCGSTNLIKTNGLFVCQDCGCKYTVEEIRKQLSGEDDSNASASKGSVSQLVRQAKLSLESEHYDKAIDLCNEVLSIDADNPYALLYKSLSQSEQSIDGIALAEVVPTAQSIPRVYQIVQQAKLYFKSQQGIWDFYREVLTKVGDYDGLLYMTWEKDEEEVEKESNELSERLYKFDAPYNPADWERSRELTRLHQVLWNLVHMSPTSFQEPLFQDAIVPIVLEIAPDNAKEILSNMVDDMIGLSENDVNKAMVKRYWREHPKEQSTLIDKKKSLESEEEQLSQQIAELEQKKTDAEESLKKVRADQSKRGKDEEASIKSEMLDLENQIAIVPFYQKKKKAALQEQLDGLQSAKYRRICKAKAQLDPEISRLEKLIKEIPREIETTTKKKEEAAQERQKVDSQLDYPPLDADA